MNSQNFTIKVEGDGEITVEESEIKPRFFEPTPQPRPIAQTRPTPNLLKKCTVCSKYTTDLPRHNACCHITCSVCSLVCENLPIYKQHKKIHEKLLHNIVINCDSSSDSEAELAATGKVESNGTAPVSKPEAPINLEEEAQRIEKLFSVNCKLPWSDSEESVDVVDLDDFIFASSADLRRVDYAKSRYLCNICHDPLEANTMTKHKANFHPTVMCDICGFAIEYHRFSHHLDVHTERFKCKDCGKVFSKQSSMEVHFRMEHSGQTNRICEICGKEFFTEKHLKMHVARHNKILNYTCNLCQKKFFNSFALKSHMRQHTDERPYQCECGQAFKHNVSLKAHKKSKHGIVEERRIACTLCDKRFASAGARLTHLRKHH